MNDTLSNEIPERDHLANPYQSPHVPGRTVRSRLLSLTPRRIWYLLLAAYISGPFSYATVLFQWWWREVHGQRIGRANPALKFTIVNSMNAVIWLSLLLGFLFTLAILMRGSLAQRASAVFPALVILYLVILYLM